MRERTPESSFKDFILDQLSALPGVRARAMFGGHGLYQEEFFFGILMQQRLYFRTDEQSRVAYIKQGMQPFVYEKARQTTTMNYYEVPADVIENRDELVAWANVSIEISRRAKLPRRRATRSSG
jgi:DNA transformation protein and related proteins